MSSGAAETALDPPRGTISSGWSRVVRTLLAGWHGGEFEAAERIDSFVARARELEPHQRAEFLFALRRRLDRFPYEWVHPSWIGQLLPADPLLSSWALRIMPRSVRGELDAAVDRVTIQAASTPEWFAEWWRRRLLERLPYPRPLPGRAAAGRPLDYLYLLPETGLKRLLRRCGARSLAAGLRPLEDREIVRVVSELPLALRARVIELSRKGDYPAVEPWSRQLGQLLEVETPVSELTLRLAIEDVAAQAAAVGGRAGAARIAYRLPHELGGLLLERLKRPLPELVNEDPESWQTELRKDLGFLSRAGALAVPKLGKELWA